MKFTKYNIQIPFIIEKNDNIIDLNPAFIALSGFIKEDLINQPFNKVWHELLHITVQPCSTALKQEAFLFTKALSVRCINISASKNIITSETTYIISEIANSRFEDNNLYLMQLSKSDLVGIAVYSVPDMLLLKANQKYLSFLEPPFDKEAISLGRRVEEIIPKWKGSSIESFWKEAICTGEVVNVNEYEHVGYNRGITYWDSIVTPILEEKRVKYVVSNIYEVTERQLLQAEMDRNKILENTIEMKDDFLSLISHELRTPLNVMSAAVQALNYICANELSDKANKYIGMIRQNTHRQLRLVNNLLDITRANANRINVHKKNIDIVFLSKAILESVYPYASQKGINLTFESLLDYRVIGMDEEKYERILLNLLSNAIKFTPEGKSIKLKLSAVKSNICVEVKDNGIGIPIDKIDTIFEKFGQVDSLLSRQAEGAGIGLSLVKRFVEVLGGSISVKSTVAKGSTFTILLPSEGILDEKSENPSVDFMNNRLVEISTVEFSDIYL